MPDRPADRPCLECKSPLACTFRGEVEPGYCLRERAVPAPGADSAYEPVRKVYTVIRREDDPGRTRSVVGICKVCDKHWPIDVLDPRVVSASGIVHHADGDTTLCGKRATSDDWWWAL